MNDTELVKELERLAALAEDRAKELKAKAEAPRRRLELKVVGHSGGHAVCRVKVQTHRDEDFTADGPRHTFSHGTYIASIAVPEYRAGTWSLYVRGRKASHDNDTFRIPYAHLANVLADVDEYNATNGGEA